MPLTKNSSSASFNITFHKYIKNMSPNPLEQYKKETRRLLVYSIASEFDNLYYEGYTELPQDPSENYVESEDANLESNSDEESLSSRSSTPSNTDEEVKIEWTELQDSSDTKATDIAMDSNKEEEIKNAMANFKLSPTSIPQWAQIIPEEQWKEHILQRIQSSKSA